MGKQILDRTKKILGISLIVLLVMSMGIATVSAAPPSGRNGGGDGNFKGGNGGNGFSPGGFGGGGDNFRNCHWVCDNWHRQRFCEHGHWVSYPYRHWVCDNWSWRWVCGHWSWRCGGRY